MSLLHVTHLLVLNNASSILKIFQTVGVHKNLAKKYVQGDNLTRAVVGQRSSPAGYILYCNIFIIKKIKMK